MGRGIVLAGFALGLAAGCLPAPFECERDAQCSRGAGGRCEAGGGCSYPDPACPSGRRHSALGPTSPGACVDDGAGSGGAPGRTCDDAPTCSGLGECVTLEGEATCACPPGYYAVGLDCLEDPCATARCSFVDSIDGDDAADGSRGAPWRTLERLEAALAGAEAGDHFLLRRGRQFSAALELRGLRGSTEGAIVIGAYGPVAEPRPVLSPGGIAILETSYLVVRDLDVRDEPGDQSRPCISVRTSDHVTIRDNAISQCRRRGVLVSEGSSYTALVGNSLRDTGFQTAIYVGDAPWVDPPWVVGSHHWIVDNVVTGSDEDGVGIRIEDAEGDVKLVGNTLVDASRLGIFANASFGWVVGNVIVRAGVSANSASFAKQGGIRLEFGRQQVHGNVIAQSANGIDAQSAGAIDANTILQSGGPYALRVAESSGPLSVRDNVVLGRDTVWLDVAAAGPGGWLGPVERNAYAPSAGLDCMFCADPMGCADAPIVGLEAWREQTGLDLASTCEPIPGLELPSIELELDPGADSWPDAITPAPTWDRCDRELAGAVDCDGRPIPVEFPPLEGMTSPEASGWSGPLVVRQRYPLPS